MEMLYLLVGVILGLIIGLLFGRKKSAEQNPLIEELNAKLSEYDKEKSVLNERIQNSIERFKIQEQDLYQLKNQNAELLGVKSSQEANLKNAEEKLSLQKKELEEIQNKLKTEFENIANRIMKQSSETVTENQQKRLHEILSPFKERIEKFEQTVKETYIDETKGRHELKEQLKNLMDLNKTISEDANNLTKALKGENKIQGNWGEFILEKVLEHSGLEKDREYTIQHTTSNSEEVILRPDVIINLPENKHIVIDSKVSLLAYESYFSSNDEAERQTSLKNHISSLKTHIKGLSEKNYALAYGINSPDFVLLFIPIEASFSLAVQGDHELYRYAWDKKIVLVSPSTLLATLRTIASVWKHERQNQNSEKIALQAGALYDKLVGFVEDFEKVETAIKKASTEYSNAMNKLKTGKGNLITRAEQMKNLGVKNSKNIPPHLIGNDDFENEI